MAENFDLMRSAGLGSPEAVQHEMHGRMEELTQKLREAEEAQVRGEKVPDYNLFGIKMPMQVGAVFETVINPVVMGLASTFYDHADKAILTHGDKLPFLKGNPGRIAVAAKVGAFVAGTGTQLSQSIIQTAQKVDEYRKAVWSVAKDIAPVLDDIKGHHGFGAFVSVSAQENEVIYAHSRRLGEAHVKGHMLNTIELAKQAPGMVVLLGKQFAAVQKMTELAKSGNNNPMMQNALYAVSGTLGPTLTLYKDSLQKEYDQAHARPSGLTMITHLAKLLADAPDLEEFDLPGSRNSLLSLPEYIAATFKCHQVDMAKLDPGSRPIRQKLEGELGAISEVIADAIRKGELSPLALVHLVGGRQIVKAGGSALIKLEDLDKVLKKYTGKTQKYIKADENQFFENFSKQDIKDALANLKGDEKLFFMSTLPDNILQLEGISDQEIKEMRDKTATMYRNKLAHAVVGLGVKDDAALKGLGLSDEEIAGVRKAAEDVKEKGIDGIDDHRMTANRKDGIESTIQEVTLSGVREKSGVPLTKIMKDGEIVLSRLQAEEKAAQAELAADEQHAERVIRDRAESGAEQGLR